MTFLRVTHKSKNIRTPKASYQVLPAKFLESIENSKLAQKLSTLLNSDNVTDKLSIMFSEILDAAALVIQLYPKRFKLIEGITPKLAALRALFSIAKNLFGVYMAAADVQENSLRLSRSRKKARIWGRYDVDDYDLNAHELSREQLPSFADFISFIVNNNEVLAIADLLGDDNNEQESIRNFHHSLATDTLLGQFFVLLQTKDMGYMSLEIVNGGTAAQISFPGNYDVVEKYVTKLQADFLATLRNKLITIRSCDDSERLVSMSVKELVAPDFYDPRKTTRLVNLISGALASGHKTTMLLYGPPGVGKTCSVTQALTKADAVVVKVGYTITDGMVAFLQRTQGVPKVVVFEEIDTDTGSLSKTKRLQQILTFLDSDYYDVALLTTNKTKLPSSLIRSGRCDIKIQFELPTLEEREVIFQNLFQYYKNRQGKELDFSTGYGLDRPVSSYLLGQTEGMSHADLNTLCKLAALSDALVDEYVDVFKEDWGQSHNYEDEAEDSEQSA